MVIPVSDEHMVLVHVQLIDIHTAGDLMGIAFIISSVNYLLQETKPPTTPLYTFLIYHIAFIQAITFLSFHQWGNFIYDSFKLASHV